MASKIILLFTVLFVIQCSEALQKRSLIGNLFAPIKDQIQKEINNGEELLKGITQTATNMIETAMLSVQNALKDFSNNVQTEVKKAEQLGRNVTLCLLDSSTKVGDIINKARQNMEDCTKAAIKPVGDLIADLGDLGGQAAQLIAAYPGQLVKCANFGIFVPLQCLFDTTANATARANLLTSAVASDAFNLGVQEAQVIPKLGKCTADGLSNATTQFTALGASEISCISNGSTSG